MIKVSDYIMQRLVEFGIKDIFIVSGGAAMHLIDALGRNPKLKYICTHHEQAAAIAAEGYARISGKMGIVLVTSGPGGTNTLTGVIGQWLDSVPCLYLSGQVKQETTIAQYPELALRQLGDQEINIVDIIRPVTKYAAIVDDPEKVRYYLDRALYIASCGRPGPVWLDIPLNIQAAMIEERNLAPYHQEEDAVTFDEEEFRLKISEAIEFLKKSQRPVFLAGSGIRISGGQDVFLNLVETIKMPIVSSFNGFDLIQTDHTQFVGRIGTIGDRAGNFALQNSDLVLSIGSRNNIRQISYNWNCFARLAKKIIVDIDAAELQKPTVKADLAVRADARRFLEELKSQLKNITLPNWENWTKWCMARKQRYPTVLPEYANLANLVHPYYFIKALTECLVEDAIIVTGNGTASAVYFQAGKVKRGQRVIWNSGCAAMGYDLPAAIGACLASGKKDIICLAGDGSLQLNIQELQTVFHHQLPIKLFVLSNCGYISIKQTQDAFFAGRYVGCNKDSGVTFPDIAKVATAYGLSTEKIDSHHNMHEKIRDILAMPGPLVCDVRLMPDYKFIPKVSSERLPDGTMVSKPLEDMYPFLDRAEFRANMLIPE